MYNTRVTMHSQRSISIASTTNGTHATKIEVVAINLDEVILEATGELIAAERRAEEGVITLLKY